MSKIANAKLVGLAATFTAGPAMAQDLPPVGDRAEIAPIDQYIISLTGGVMWSSFPQVNPVEGLSTPVPGFDADELGFGEDKFSVLPDNEIGGYGMLEVEKYNGDGAWDWRGAIQYSGFSDASGSRYIDDFGFDGFARGKAEFRYGYADVDVGKTWGDPDNFTRAAVGVRILGAELENRFSPAIDSVPDLSEDASKMSDARYWGVGITGRFDAQKPISERFSLLGTADAGLLVGSVDQKAVWDDGFGSSTSISENSFAFAAMASGSAGIGWAISETVDLELRGRVEALQIDGLDLIGSAGITIGGRVKLN